MEKPPIESGKDSFEDYHARVKELLGNNYDEQRVNGCMAFQAPGETEKIYEELKRALESAKSEEEKDAIRDAWLNKYDVMRGITH